MEAIHSVFVLGGDRRQCALAEALAARGYAVRSWGLPKPAPFAAQSPAEGLADAQAVILPLPCSKDDQIIFCADPAVPPLEVDRLAAMLRPEQTVTGGMLTSSVAARLQRAGCRVIDYYQSEEIVVRNLVPTVEGLLEILLRETDVTVSGSRCAVLGFGRLGRAASRTLHALGAQVTVCARSAADRAKAEINGCDACAFASLREIAPQLDFLINTVPARVLGAAELSRMRPGTLILDAASAPYGTDFAAAERFGLRALQCASLPGKAAPVTAGRILAQGIIHLWEEEGYA